MHPVIEMRNITKCFPGVVANQNINLTVMPGEIHALLGENGAGKTTLMNILSGMYRPDSGEILLHGRKVFLKSPFYALKKGVGMIYQHFKLVSSFTVAENVVLGDPRAPIFMRQRKLEKRVKEIAGAYGFNLNMSDKVGQLSIGEQQRVEILRALYRKSDVLIMDEPTTVLTPDEVKDLFSILRRMAAQGKAIILITHKLHEVMAVADSVTVLRRGEVVDTIPASQADEGLLARMMVGREADWERHSVEEEAGKPVLEMQAVSVRGDKGNMAIDGLKLDLKSGEILAIAGVAGNGQKELVEAMAGLRPIASGKMLLEKRDVTNRSVRAMTSLGVRLVPEDRLGMGLVGGMGVPDNMILRDYFIPRYGKRAFLNYPIINEKSHELLKRFSISIPGLGTPVKVMSGGNLQRLLLAREMSQSPKVLIAAYPVRGLDVAATEAVYNLLWEERDKGTAILLIMEDIEEIRRVADRVAVMYNGRLSRSMPVNDLDIEVLGRLMAGIDEVTS